MNLAELVASIMEKAGPTRIVAIDGPGGAGKSTLAQQLSEAAGGAPVIHTDDFAAADNPIDWWPRLLRQVIEPLVRGEPARYQRYDWATEKLAEWQIVEPAPIIILEGVSAGRIEWAAHLSFVIWIETPREERLRRGLERDGAEAVGFWEHWMSEEEAHYEKDPVRARADLVLDGTRSIQATSTEQRPQSPRQHLHAALRPKPSRSSRPRSERQSPTRSLNAGLEPCDANSSTAQSSGTSTNSNIS